MQAQQHQERAPLPKDDGSPVEITTVAEDIAGPAPAGNAGGLLDSIVQDHEAALRQMEEMAERRKRRIRTLCGLVPRQCWVDMGGRPYIEGQGVMTVFEALGIVRVGMPEFRWFDDEVDGSRTCRVTLTFRNKLTGEEYPPIIGTRAIGGIMDSDADLLKAAQKNAFHHAGLEILGLGGLSWDELKAYAGIEPATTVHYEKGSRGGKHSSRNSDGVMCLPNFGKQGGQPIPSVETNDLRWYAETLWKSVQDPKKERFRASNQSVLDAISAELDSREKTDLHDQHRAGGDQR